MDNWDIESFRSGRKALIQNNAVILPFNFYKSFILNNASTVPTALFVFATIRFRTKPIIKTNGNGSQSVKWPQLAYSIYSNLIFELVVEEIIAAQNAICTGTRTSWKNMLPTLFLAQCEMAFVVD